MTVTVVVRPESSLKATRGMSSAHSIVKCGSTIFERAGRFSQIWNSSMWLGLSSSSRGNISEWEIPAPAVTHCTSPRPNLAAAPSESAWSMRPERTKVTVSKPRWGWAGQPGTTVPWYIDQPSLPLKSLPMLRPPVPPWGPRSGVPAG
jgi:hypothetical protein